MTLQERLQRDLQRSIQLRAEHVSILKLIVGELQRLPDKILTDEQVIATLKKLVKSERENLDREGKQTSTYMDTLLSYLPQAASEEEVKAWILANVPTAVLASNQKFTWIKNVLAHFGSRTDGAVVKKILGSLS